jgi:class 3 adenylate cyclase/tetratricopeptide (TPR) repeat protein
VGSGGTVTVLFTDLVGSTELLDRLGDDAAEELRQTHFGLLREVVQEHGGHEVKSLGDGLMVAFPSTLGGIACAAAMQGRVAEFGERAGAEMLKLRVGVNVGEVISAEDDFFGTPVVVAKRLCDLAGAGEVLVSAVARAMVGTRGGYRFMERGSLLLKGFADPVPAFELDWQSGPAVARRDRPPVPRSLMQEVRTALAGRHDELDVLADALSGVKRGSLHIVMVGGEHGIGKTRLAAEFAQTAYDDGAAVLFGRSDPEQLVAFQPFVEALADGLAGVGDGRARGLFGSCLPGLTRLLPGLGARFPDAAGAWAPVDSETDRFRLFEAVVGFLTAVADERPVVFVLDDLHWADKPTLALLRHVSRNAASSPILVVGTYRDVEVGRDHVLGHFLAERHRGVPITLLPLGGLTPEELGALAVNWAGRELPAELARTLWEETEGHPFFAQEVLRQLLATGAIQERRGRLVTAGSTTTAVPRSVREVIDQRLARWQREELDLLKVASVIGRDFDVGLVERVAEPGGTDRLLRLLDDATAAQIVAPVPGAPERYRFSHGLIREALYDGISPAWRVRLHQRVAETLERSEGPDGLPLAELARHYFAAASASEAFTKAVDYAVAAGRAAASQLAYEEASDHFERALRALELQQGEERTRAGILVQLGDSRWAAGEFAAARVAFADAAHLADGVGDVELLATAALGFAGRIGFQGGVVDDQMIGLLERALERLGPEQAALRAKVMGRLCEALTLAAPLPRRVQLAEEAISLARATEDDETLVEVLLRTRWGTGAPDNLDECLASLEELFSRAEALGDTRRFLEACCWRVLTCVQAGQPDRAQSALDRMNSAVAESHDSYLHWLQSVAATLMAFNDRHADELERLMWETLRRGQAAQNSTAIALFGGHLIYLRLLQGRLAEIHAMTVAMAEQFPDVPAFRAALAFVNAEIGLHDAARAEIDDLAAHDFADLPRDVVWLTAVDVLAIACNTVGDPERAELLYGLLLPCARQTIIAGVACAPTGSVHGYLALLATTTGRYDDAENHFRQSFAWDLRTGARLPYLRSRVDYAAMLVQRDSPGDHEFATAVIEETLRSTRDLGLDGLTTNLLRLRGRLTGEPQRPVKPPAGRFQVIAGGAKAAVSTRGRNAIARIVTGSSDDDIQRRLDSPIAQRALFTAMAQGFQPRMAFGFQGAISIGLHNSRTPLEVPTWWTLTVSGKRATVRRERSDSPAVTIETDVATFMRLFSGDLNPLSAWLSGRVAIEGDVTVGARLIELFGGIKPFDLGQSG